MPQRNAILDLTSLLAAVRAADTNPLSHLHGEHHWRCVAWTGLQLAQVVGGVDREIVFLFGLFHDSQRLDDGHDPEHGRRAARLVGRMHARHFWLEAKRLSRLIDACAGHVDGRLSDDPTIGVCWDADRLNLWRIGVTPRAQFLSTAAARQTETIERAAEFEGGRMEWWQIFDVIRQAKP